jgi:hypothetical protein
MKRFVLRRMPAGTSVWERTSFRMLLFGAFSNHLIHRRCTKTARHFGPMNDSAQSPPGASLPNQRSMSGARMNASVKINHLLFAEGRSVWVGGWSTQLWRIRADRLLKRQSHQFVATGSHGFAIRLGLCCTARRGISNLVINLS